MSGYRSEKCSKEQLKQFKEEVIAWLDSNFQNWKDKFKIKAFTSYNGDVRLYDGTSLELPNSKESFRRETPKKDESGKIIGWHGTRGKHTTKQANYITINRDEFQDIKTAWQEKNDDYDSFDDLIFRRLKIK